MSEGTKREYRISSEDAARPKADLNSEPHYFAQGLKPKARHAVGTTYVDNKDGSCTKNVEYNDGVVVSISVHPENPDCVAALAAQATAKTRTPTKPKSSKE
jgi:hypothetical protein